MASLINTKGVDISYANGNIDLNKVKNNGYNFVMIRCGYGSDLSSQDDTQFENNVKKAESLGLPWGVYLYSYATNQIEAKSEVEHIKRLLKNKKPTMPVAIDIEDRAYYQKNSCYNKTAITSIVKTILEGIKSAGYYPMLYTGKYWLDGYDGLSGYIDKSVWSKYDIWLASWTSSCTYSGNNLGIWQYGGETNVIENNSISGIGIIDKDKCYKDYPAIIKNGGYNGWKKSSITSTLKICRKSLTTYVGCKYAFWQTGATNPKWTTSNTKISKIDSNGVLTLFAIGTTIVTVTDGKSSASCKVIIKKGIDTGISIKNATMVPNKTYQLTAKTKGVTWFSSNPKVVTVNKKGKLTAKTLGYATIHAYNQNGSSTCVVHVIAKPKVQLCRNTLTMYSWCKYAFWQKGLTNPKWTTSNDAISRIDSNGILTVTASGATTVTVTDGKNSASCRVTVNNGKDTGISVRNATMIPNKTYQLTAKYKDVQWFSSNPNVVTVDNKGKITAKALGYATIHAYNKNGSSTCVVHVIPKQTNNNTITESQLRKKVANIINGWLGAVQGDSTHAEILRIYNSQNPLPVGYKVQPNDAWCAATVSATWLKAGIAEYTGTECGCGRFRDNSIKRGIWVENDAYKPKIGDAVIYSWDDNGIGDCQGSADHIGIVTEVNDSTFIVTEGNMGNGIVGKRTMNINGRYIRGFIAPDYATIAKKIKN